MRRLLVWCLAMALAGGCGGNGGGGAGDSAGGDDVGGGGGGGGGSGEDSREELPAPLCPSSNWVLEPFGIFDGMPFQTGGTMLLQARIYDSVLKTPVAGQPVSFALTGAGDAALLEGEALTSDQGVAAVELDTGTTQGVSYALTISNPCAGKAELELESVAPEYGTFAVTFVITEELAAIEAAPAIDLFADFTKPLCGQASFTNPGQPLAKLPAGQTSIELEQVLANAPHLVFGIARGKDGAPIGAGCAEGVLVMPDQTKEVQVELKPLALDPSGGYDLTLKLDVASLLEPAWNDAGQVAAEVVAGSGEAIYKKVMADLMVWFPEGLPDCGETSPAEEIQASIQAGMAAVKPEEIEWLAANADALLAELLAAVTVKGKLMVEATPMNDLFQATWTIESLAFSGDVDCGEADCAGWLLFTPDLFNLGDVHLDLNQFQFNLNTVGHDQLTVEATELPFNPGKLALFAFANIVVRLRGHSAKLNEMFTSFYSCSTLLAQVSAPTIACLNKPQTQLIESCDKAVAALAGAFYDQMAPWLETQVLAASGELNSLDDDNDLVVDSLQGKLEGDYLNGGAKLASFLFPFTAVRKK